MRVRPRVSAIRRDLEQTTRRSRVREELPGALDAINHAHTLAPQSLIYQRGLIEMTYLVKGKDAG